MRHGAKAKPISTRDKAKELVRTILSEDFHQKVSQRKIDQVAAEIVQALPKSILKKSA